MSTDLFGDKKILALSWKQPYAELMLHGKIETRKWNTNYRGLVLICASKASYKPRQVLNISGPKWFAVISRLLEGIGDLMHFNRGYAIAVGELVECRMMEKQDEEKCFVDYWEPYTEWTTTKSGAKRLVWRRLYCHIYKDVRAIKPFKFKGSQRFSKLTEEQLKQIQYI